MTQHTPGPWKAIDVSGANTLVYRRIDANGQSIGFAGAYKLRNKVEALANACLIAAAPTMLEALYIAADALAEIVAVNGGEKQADALADVRAVIAAAEGR